MKKKVLFVSIALPPKKDPECIQTGRYIKYLNDLGFWEIEAVTSSIPTLFMPYDSSIENYVEGIHVHTVPIYENKIINGLIRKIFPSLLERPDSKMTFHWQWKGLLKKIEKPDIIYSRSFPLSSTIMALKLKLHYNVPWIMHLSDPWVESAIHDEQMKKSEYQNKMERLCFMHADVISLTNKQTVSLYSKKYPEYAQKFKVFPNVYDPALADFGRLEKDDSEKLRVVYTGGLANTRSALPLLHSIDLIHKSSPHLLNKIEILFAGDTDSKNKDHFKSFAHLSCIKHVGLLSQQQAFELQKTADILLVIDSKIDDISKNVFFPSKLLDYHGIGRFILAVTEKNSPTFDFVAETNGKSFSFTETDQMAEWIKGVLEGRIMLPTKIFENQFYSAKHQAKTLSQNLHELLQNNNQESLKSKTVYQQSNSKSLVFRKLVFKLLYHLKITPLLQAVNSRSGRFPILLFHRVTPHHDPFWVPLTPESFEKILLLIKKHYNILVLESILNYSNDDLRNGCFITFDDTFEDNYTWARPILLKHAVPASFFAPTRPIESGNVVWQLQLRNSLYHTTKKELTIAFEETSFSLDLSSLEQKVKGFLFLLEFLGSLKEEKFLVMMSTIFEKLGSFKDENITIVSIDQLKSLASNFGIHSHSQNHYYLARLSPERVVEEFRQSLQDLRKWIPLTNPLFFAYPVGNSTDRVANEARNHFDAAFRVGDRLVHIKKLREPDYRMKIPRFNIHFADPYEVYAKINGVHRFLKTLRGGG